MSVYICIEQGGPPPRHALRLRSGGRLLPGRWPPRRARDCYCGCGQVVLSGIRAHHRGLSLEDRGYHGAHEPLAGWKSEGQCMLVPTYVDFSGRQTSSGVAILWAARAM